MTFDGPFRGYAPIPDAVLAAARAPVKIAGVAAAPLPISRRGCAPKGTLDSVYVRVVRALYPKLNRIESQYLGYAREIELAAWCSCGSESTVRLPDLAQPLELTPNAVVQIKTRLDRLGCSCVVADDRSLSRPTTRRARPVGWSA